MACGEWHLAEMIRLGLLDGPLTDSQRNAVIGIASDLGMTPAQAYGVISLTEQTGAGEPGA
jgi:hypothetical protein